MIDPDTIQNAWAIFLGTTAITAGVLIPTGIFMLCCELWNRNKDYE